MDRRARSAPELLWRTEGPPALAVYADGSRRTLEFGHGTVQTRVDLAAPHRLELPYTRALAAALLLAPAPRTGLMLGLGGGALAHFLVHHLAGLELHAVESSAEVIRAARRYFRLPADPPLSIEHADARDAISRIRARHDLVLVDLFDVGGLPRWVCEPSFFRSVRGTMRPRSVLAVNLWVTDDDELLEVMHGVRDAFDGRVLALAVPGYRNLVVFALPDGPRRVALTPLRGRAGALGERTGIDFAAIVDTLAASNLVVDGELVLVADGARA